MIRMQNCSKTYQPGRRALQNIDLDIQPGETFTLLGPNGSGKSTLLRILMGIIQPDPGGSVTIGTDGSTGFDQFAFQPQVPAFPPEASGKEILDLLESISGPAVHREELQRELNTGPFMDRPFQQLSEGMKQKLNIIQCFGFERKVYVLDEPSAGLDPDSMWLMKELIRKRSREGSTVLFTSHIMAEVEELSDRMGMLLDGEMKFIAEPEQFIREQSAGNLEEAIRNYNESN